MTFTDIWEIRPTPSKGSVVTGDGFRITVLTDRLIRLEYESGSHFRDGATQAVINREFPLPEFTFSERGNRMTIETAAVRLEYDRRPFSPEGLSAVLKSTLMNHASVWHYGESEMNLKSTARTLDGANGRMVGKFASHDDQEPLHMEDGLMSADGFAVLDDSHTMGLDASGNLTPADGVSQDLYLFAYGHDFRQALKDYYHLSGAVPPLPRYALGNWWSRYYSYSEDSYKALMERFAKEQVPLSVAVLDMDWHITDIDPIYGAGWTGYTWNSELFPDPAGLMDWLHERNLKVTVNDHPADGIRAYETLYPAMAREMGIDPDSGYPVDFDASSAQFLEAFEKVVLDSFEKTGLDFWWIDWQQRGGSSVPGVDPLFVLNHTRWLYANRKGDVGLTLSRFAGPGSHRYPLGFSGDTCITWDSLAFQPYFTATAANIGYGWWSHDIGGHMMGIRDDELMIRWLQFGVFSPVMRLHSSLSEFLVKEPWSYPMEPRAIMEEFLRLRHRLVPWLYTRMLKASEEGITILYPVYYDWNPGLDLFKVEHDEYMFGSEMLVVPITSPCDRETHLGSARAWLPEGQWVDFFTGMRYTGGQCLRVYRPLSGIPVFVRTGTILPLDGKTAPENGCPLPEEIVFRVFAGANGEGVLTEDNGRRPGTDAYRSCTTVCRLEEGDSMTIRLAAAEGDRTLLPEGRRISIEIAGINNRLPDEASCGYTSEYDALTRTLKLTLDAAPKDGAVLTWNRYPECPASDLPDMLYRLLLPMQISNVDKDTMLKIAQTVDTPQRRLASWMALGLSDSLMGALAELECIT